MRTAVSFALGGAALVAVLACQSPRLRHASPDEFLSHASRIREIESARWVEFVGASRTRAYLEVGVIGSSGEAWTVVYWTELGGLPGELAASLRSGEDPWRAELGGRPTR